MGIAACVAAPLVSRHVSTVFAKPGAALVVFIHSKERRSRRGGPALQAVPSSGPVGTATASPAPGPGPGLSHHFPAAAASFSFDRGRGAVDAPGLTRRAGTRAHACVGTTTRTMVGVRRSSTVWTRAHAATVHPLLLKGFSPSELLFKQ